jgi:diketogulonate reductase-like aldo/keto reductase
LAPLANELNISRSQVALAWTLLNPAVVSPMMGARTLDQAKDNFGALDISFSADQIERLNAAGALPPTFPERFVRWPMAQQLIFGRSTVRGGSWVAGTSGGGIASNVRD